MANDPILPTQVTFLACELARNEPDGKLSLLGIFVGEQIKVTGAIVGPSVQMPAFAAVFFMEDGEGNFDASIEIVAPGLTTLKLPVTVEKKPNTRGVVVGQIYGLSLTPGSVSVNLVLNSKTYEHKLEIIFG